MKQKIVIRVGMPCEKCRTKAMEVAAKADGVISLSVDRDKDQLEVVGDGVDVTCLVACLRKKVGHAAIELVEEVKPKKEEKEEDDKKKTDEPCCLVPPYWYGPLPPAASVVCYEEPSSGACSIM